MPNPVRLYLSYWKSSFDFKGRTKRNEYLWTALIAILPLIIWLSGNFQWHLDYVTYQTAKGNYLFALPPGVYAFSAINLIPAIALNCRRLVDAGVDRRWLFAYFATNIGANWVWCIALRPSYDQDQTNLLKSKAFERRSTDNTSLLVVSFFIPLGSLFFGIRRRSMEIALMPIAGAGFISRIMKGIKYLAGYEVNSGVKYLLAGLAASILAYVVDKHVKKTSAALALKDISKPG